MAKFLNRAELFRLLQRELPDSVYPDGAPEAFLSTASIDAKAKTLADTYDAIGRLYANFFPQSASGQIDEWEIKIFGYKTTESLTETERVNRLLARIRAQPDLSRWSLLTQIASIIPGIVVDIVESFKLDNFVSGDIRGDLADQVWGPDWTAGDPAPFGVTVTDEIRNNQTELLSVRKKAFTYYVIIFSQSIAASLIEDIRQTLSNSGPARSDFLIIQFSDIGIPFASDNGIIERDTLPEQSIEVDENGYHGRVIGWFGFDNDTDSLSFGDTTIADEGGLFWPIYLGRE